MYVAEKERNAARTALPPLRLDSNLAVMSSVDDIWASLQEETSEALSKNKKREQKIRTAKAKALKEVPKKVEEKAPSSSVDDKETTAENVAQHMHFHIRSVIGGNLGERKESLRVIARCVTMAEAGLFVRT